MSTFPIDSATVVSWSFQEASAVTSPVAEDRAIANFTGVHGGTIVAGLVGANARHFNGTTSDWLASANGMAVFTPTWQGEWTIEVLLMPDASPPASDGVIIMQGGVQVNGSNDNAQAGVVLRSDLKVYGFWQQGNQIYVNTAFSTGALVAAKWNYLTVVKTLSGGIATLSYYFNGVFINSVGSLTNATNGLGNQSFGAGTFPFNQNAANMFKGSLNGARFSNRARTPTEITAQNALFGLGTGPRLVSAAWSTTTYGQVTVTFLAPVDSATAANPANYTIPGLTVTGASYSNSVATLTVTGEPGTGFSGYYTLTVANVLDPTLATAIASPFDSVSFNHASYASLYPPPQTQAEPAVHAAQTWHTSDTPFTAPTEYGGGILPYQHGTKHNRGRN